MRIRLWAALASALTVSVGFITVLGLLIGDNLGALSEVASALYLRQTANVLLEIVTITIALTVLIGILNLVLVHLGRLNRRRSAPYSLVLLISFGLVVVLYAFRPADSLTLLETVQLSVESALAALLDVRPQDIEQRRPDEVPSAVRLQPLLLGDEELAELAGGGDGVEK